MKPGLHYFVWKLLSDIYKSSFIHSFIGPLHWFPVATGRIVGLSLKADRGLHASRYVSLRRGGAGRGRRGGGGAG